MNSLRLVSNFIHMVNFQISKRKRFTKSFNYPLNLYVITLDLSLKSFMIRGPENIWLTFDELY